MYGAAKLKVPGGKLISVRLTYGESIKEIQIIGDFFINPEGSLAEIEKALNGASVKDSKEELAARIAQAVNLNHAELIGMDPTSIAEVVSLAIDNGEDNGSLEANWA